MNPTHTARVKLPRIVITEFAIDTGLARFLYKDVSIPRKAINQEGSILDLRINEQSRYVMTTPDKDGNRWEFSEELLIDIKEIEPEPKETAQDILRDMQGEIVEIAAGLTPKIETSTALMNALFNGETNTAQGIIKGWKENQEKENV